MVLVNVSDVVQPVDELEKKTKGANKEVLFISYDGLTDPLGQSQILPYIIGLTGYGYNFTILSCDKPERLQQKRGIINEIIKAYPIDWVPLLYHKSPPVLSSVYDYRNMLRTAVDLHKQKRFSLVHTRPGLPPLVALQLKKKYGIKFLNDVRGFWADERVDGKLWNLDNPIYKAIYGFFKQREAECLQLNDYTTCLTHSAKKEMSTWKLIKDTEKIEVIPCSVDIDLFNPERFSLHDKAALKQDLDIGKEDFVISYLGSIGTWYMINEMFRFIQALQTQKKNLKFLVITPATDHAKVRQYATNFGLEESRLIIRELDRKEVPLYLSICHYSIFFIKPCYSKLSSSPTKHGEIMAMGIPVITNSGVGDVKEIVEVSDSGFLINHFSDEEYAAVIEKMTMAQFNRAAIRKAAEEYYSLTNAINQYKKVYREILE